jgi:hypothetical protein
MFPSKDRLTICFAHVAYQMQERFLPRRTGINSFSVRTPDEFERRIGEADVVVAKETEKVIDADALSRPL